MADVLSPHSSSQPSFYPPRSSPVTYFSHESPNLAPSHSQTTSSFRERSSDHAQLPHSNASIKGHASSPSLSSHSTSSTDLKSLFTFAAAPAYDPSASGFTGQGDLDSDEDSSYDGNYDTQYGEHESRYEVPDQESTLDTASDASLPTPTVVDDTAVRQEPSQHVDYLSHDWKEEDVWSSWRHIVSQRKTYGQQSRLENAAWRTWVKNKYQLRTVSPETLNWLKESDVTWLYGPLKPAQTSNLFDRYVSAPDSQISKSNSFIGIHKKPILKKRSMSEVMLQRSISTSTLVKQAAASVQAQEKPVWRLDGMAMDLTTNDDSTAPSSRDGSSDVVSPSTSGTQTPSECREKKHIRFDDTVEQCIAVEAKPEEYDAEEEEDERPGSSLSSNSSDEGLVMMRKPRRPTLASRQGSGKNSRSGSHQGRRTIENLPSTTLKYRVDSPDISEQQQQQAASKWGSKSRLSPSASQETLRPSRPSRNFLLGTDEDDEEENEETSWSFGANNPRSSLGASSSSTSLSRKEATSLPHSRSSSALDLHSQIAQPEPQRQLQALQSEPGAYGLAGMRRTESGMFMPEDDEDDDAMATGLLGKISDTVNTARDIAHVIWNVGWRK